MSGVEKIKEASVATQAVMRELTELTKSLNELEHTEISAYINGWEVNLKKVAETKNEPH